jgi:hypothetical protein
MSKLLLALGLSDDESKSKKKSKSEEKLSLVDLIKNHVSRVKI